ncbi:MAG: carboxynorspermidine decarboxylase [Verrucomicrobiota bacterium]
MARYLISTEALENNARILSSLADESGAKIVLALKAFALWPTFPLLAKYLHGCCASGLWEAQLSHQKFQKDTLTYSPAYSHEDLTQLLEISTHLDFNSLSQWHRFRDQCLSHPRHQTGALHFGLRINPQHSTGQTPLYDPCSPGSRLGITADQLHDPDLSGISTLHLHTLCEQPFADLASTVEAVENQFQPLLSSPKITNLNLGGGHWITKPDYDRPALIELIQHLSSKYRVQIWLEPGEALAIHSGILETTVLDVFTTNNLRHAILDISPTCHTPDVLEMPYRPDITLREERGAAAPQNNQRKTHPPSQAPVPHRLGGLSCLAGDTFGDYSFPRTLKIGDTLSLHDMAHYTFVKSTLFNGIPHPDLALQHPDGTIETLRNFTFHDFESRLGNNHEALPKISPKKLPPTSTAKK